jgi:hypothetical protein
VHGVEIDGMEINVPPKEDRPTFTAPDDDQQRVQNSVSIQDVRITNSRLTLLPKDSTKPL